MRRYCDSSYSTSNWTEEREGNGAQVVLLEYARFVLRRRQIVAVLDARVTNLDHPFDDRNVISLELDTRWPFSSFSSRRNRKTWSTSVTRR